MAELSKAADASRQRGLGLTRAVVWPQRPPLATRWASPGQPLRASPHTFPLAAKNVAMLRPPRRPPLEVEVASHSAGPLPAGLGLQSLEPCWNRTSCSAAQRAPSCESSTRSDLGLALPGLARQVEVTQRCARLQSLIAAFVQPRIKYRENLLEGFD